MEVDSVALLAILLEGRTSFEVRVSGRAILPQDWGGSRSFERKRTDDHLLWGIASGELEAKVEGGPVRLPSGSVMWIHGGLRGRFSLAEGVEQSEVLFLRFHLGEGERLLERFHLAAVGVERLGELVLLHQRRGSNDPLASLRLRAGLAALLGEILVVGEAPVAGGLRPEQREQCLAFIHANLTRFFSLKELAEAVRLNPVYLSGRFRVSFGQSLQSYIKEARIRRGRAALLESTQSVETVALQLGYSDVTYFSRQFRAVTGMGPRAWRRSGGRRGIT